MFFRLSASMTTLFALAAVFILILPSWSCRSGFTRMDRGERSADGNRFDPQEARCLQKGWQRRIVEINGIQRKVFWRGPRHSWTGGAIIALHGGGGAYTNFCGDLPLCRPMVEFSDFAIMNGFSVFSLDSTDAHVTDKNGRFCGKRWDSMALPVRDNVDLPFIERVIADIIPGLRPRGSVEHIFITGISNGGYMTILAATHFRDRITAFAPVSSGDPYGTYMDMDTHPFMERLHAPGVFRDNDTHRLISEKNASAEGLTALEVKWPQVHKGSRMPWFKQFHHRRDGIVDISCMRRAQRQLNSHGYMDDGPFIIKKGLTRRLMNHFWQRAYNRPLMDFFHRRSTTPKAVLE
jgi:pimeloyl-ACP methyl ester carboxylesterase